MTAQTQDGLLLADVPEPYALVGVAGGPLFQPAEYEFVPQRSSTACWRGVHATYRLLDHLWSRLVTIAMDAGGPLTWARSLICLRYSGY